MSQKDQILAYLKRWNGINNPKALDYFRCYRLSARIYELRRDGHLIKAVPDGKFVLYVYRGKRK